MNIIKSQSNLVLFVLEINKNEFVNIFVSIIMSKFKLLKYEILKYLLSYLFKQIRYSF